MSELDLNYYLLDDDYGSGSRIGFSIPVKVQLTDLELLLLIRNKPVEEIQIMFDTQIKEENYEGAQQLKRVINLLNSKVCRYSLAKPFELKVNF